MRLLSVLSALALTAAAQSDASVPLPSQDSFYLQPANISAYKPGQIVRQRDVSNHISGFIGGPGYEVVKRSVQYFYATIDSENNTVGAVTTLLIPNKPNKDQLVSYQQAYDSANNNCSPSYALRAGANVTAVSDIVFIVAALNDGNYVNTPDFEGLRAQFVAGKQAAYATLDSVRAVLSDAATADSGLSKNARKVMWGYSGGALATEWASELLPSYAPELHFEGAAMGGLTPNVTSVVYTIDNSTFSGLAFSGIKGIADAYRGPNSVGDLQAYVDQHLIPSKREEFYGIANGCLTQTTGSGANKKLESYFDNGLSTLNATIPKAVLLDGGLMGTHGTPPHPMYFYKAAGDEISKVADTDQLYSTLCAKGATIEYHRDLVGEHVSEAIVGSASAFAWVRDRVAGRPVSNPGKCTKQNVVLTTPTLPTGLAAGAELVALLETLLVGAPLGLGLSG